MDCSVKTLSKRAALAAILVFTLCAYAFWTASASSERTEFIPDYYYKVEANLEINGKSVTLKEVRACQIIENRPIGGGATAYPRTDPALSGMKLRDGRGLFLIGTQACMWAHMKRPEMQDRRMRAYDDPWLSGATLEGVVRLLITKNFENPTDGEYYFSEEGYESPDSQIKYISGKISMATKDEFDDWIKATSKDTSKYLFRFDDLHSQTPKRQPLNLYCSALFEFPHEYISEKMTPEIKDFIAQNDERAKKEPVPFASIIASPHDVHTYFFQKADPRIIKDGYGILPYGDGYFGKFYRYVSLDTKSLVLTADLSRKGVMDCHAPPNRKSYMTYDYKLHLQERELDARWQAHFYYQGKFYYLEINLPTSIP